MWVSPPPFLLNFQVFAMFADMFRYFVDFRKEIANWNILGIQSYFMYTTFFTQNAVKVQFYQSYHALLIEYLFDMVLWHLRRPFFKKTY